MRDFFQPLLQFLRPKPPFTDETGDKGWWNSISRAQDFEITTHTFNIPGWDQRHKPLKIAVLADLHLGSHTDDIGRMDEIITRTNDWNPDITLLLGDFMNTQFLGGGHIPPQAIASLLSQIKNRLGTYAELGNHDWHYDGTAVWHALEKEGIIVLENSARQIEDEFGNFWIVGMADEQTRCPDIDAATEPLVDGNLALIMAHDPATFSEVPDGPYLTLSGHTHGGQFRIPFIGPIVNSSSAPLRWSAGHIIEGDRHLFVSRGLGTSVVPFRLNCLPEICFLTIADS